MSTRNLNTRVRSDVALQRFYLPAHLYACRIAGDTVLLDLQRNRYFALAESESQTLGRLIGKDPRDQRTQSMPPEDDVMATAAEALIKAGVIERHPTGPRLFAPVDIDLTGALMSIDDLEAQRRRARLIDLIRFGWHCAGARWALRSASLYTIACQMRMAKSQGRRDGEPSDAQRLCEFVDVFRHLRPFAFTAQDQCLFHALALTRFLNAYQLFPTWVIGVRLRPWAAHSWVQHGALLLDATPDQVREYTPIFAI